MCKLLGIPRSSYYHESQKKEKPLEDPIESKVIESFQRSFSNYGTRKIKADLQNQGIVASRRRIGRMMAKHGLISNYTVAKYKPQPLPCNNDEVKNELNREFIKTEPLDTVVSDLTYVRVNGEWHYICLLIDLYNREIIGHSVGAKKDASLVYEAFSSVSANLYRIKLFHTDRGGEFKNKMIDHILTTFEIERSLSMKGCPYDNAVAEATFKIFKTEFVHPRNFESLEQLREELDSYVLWFNHIRCHSTLGYLSPIAYKLKELNQFV